jgi:hypothetical protein
LVAGAATYEAEANMRLTNRRTSGVFDESSVGICDRSRYVRDQADCAVSLAVAAHASEIHGDDIPADDVLDAVTAVPAGLLVAGVYARRRTWWLPLAVFNRATRLSFDGKYAYGYGKI